MINPTAIIGLDNATVQTPDGCEQNVNRIAVWDWYIKEDDNGSYLECHTNDGEMFVDPDAVTNIVDLE